jgi:uncharacterized DUF497 family protein
MSASLSCLSPPFAIAHWIAFRFSFIGSKARALAFSVAEDRKSGSKRVRAISLRPATEQEIKNYGLSKKKPT